jgi:hypothetical protein
MSTSQRHTRLLGAGRGVSQANGAVAIHSKLPGLCQHQDTSGCLGGQSCARQRLDLARVQTIPVVQT